MNHKELAEKLLGRVAEVQVELGELKGTVTLFLSTLLKGVKEDILQCQTEDDLLKVCAELSDSVYKGNAITEAVDGTVFLLILKGVDKFALDKIFGNDWFVKFRAFVESL